MKRILITGATGFVGYRPGPLLVVRVYELHAATLYGARKHSPQMMLAAFADQAGVQMPWRRLRHEVGRALGAGENDGPER